MQSTRILMQTTVASALGYVLSITGLVSDRLEGRKNDRGATAVEYGLLVGLIAIVIIVGVSALGGRLQKIFAQLAKTLGG